MIATIALFMAGSVPVAHWAEKKYGVPHRPTMWITIGLMTWYDIAKAIVRAM